MSRILGFLLAVWSGIVSAKNASTNVAPADSGSTRIGPVLESKDRMVPDLMGKPLLAPETRKYLEASGFSIRIVGYVNDGKVAPGTVLSQKPAPWSEVKEPLVIQVTVSRKP